MAMSQNASSTAVVLRGLRERSALERAVRGLLRFCKQKPLGAAGGFLVLLLIFTALFASVLAPYEPLKQDLTKGLLPPGGAHLMGTDNLGRDVLSRIIYGSQISLMAGIGAVTLGVSAGTVIGLVSAYWMGKLDLILQRVMDSLQAFPLIVLALAIVAVLGASVINVIGALAVVLTPGFARVIRGSVLSVKENQYVEAARALGASDLRIILQHILLNVTAPIIVLVSIYMGSAIIVEASLSFLGAGTPPPTPTWGGMLSGTGRMYFEIAPWLAVFPGVAISLAVLGFNLFGDALRDVLDPRLRGT